jgi:hypothetical protein
MGSFEGYGMNLLFSSILHNYQLVIYLAIITSFHQIVQITTFNISMVVHGTAVEGNSAVSILKAHAKPNPDV